MDALVALIGDLKAARSAGRPDAELELARTLQRQAQFRLDFVEAENSTGFHAPGEAARILAESINLAREGQLAVRDPAYRPEFVNTAPPSQSDSRPRPAGATGPSQEQ